MVVYCNKVRKLEDKFDGLELNHITRRFNEAADELHKPSIHYEELGKVCNAPPVLDSGADPKKVCNTPPVPDSGAGPPDPEVMKIDTDPAEGAEPPLDWRALYLDYLLRKLLPTDKTKARRIARRAKSFGIIDQDFYKRSHTSILQRYIPIEQGKSLLQDIHAGACDHHAAPRTLIGNAFRRGFNWPTAVADATRVVCTYEGCQFFARQAHLPTQPSQKQVRNYLTKNCMNDADGVPYVGVLGALRIDDISQLGEVVFKACPEWSAKSETDATLQA
ncbi:uncharacterized protein [Setaria viridis]|uniref:uncharacterized protein n=1 Tax=Setaria viridis TaxID=4556 RepID=UPI0014936E6D|nr:uncharacterized protein LOC117849256 [Setaria viridis]